MLTASLYVQLHLRGFRLEQLHLVGALPRQVDVRAAEVAEGRRLAVDRAAQVAKVKQKYTMQ